MKKFIVSLILLGFVASIGPPVSAMDNRHDPACVLADAKGRLFRTDCHGLIIADGNGTLLYFHVDLQDGIRRDVYHTLNLFYTDDSCSGVPYMFSNVLTGYALIESPQYVDDTHIFYADPKGGPAINGSQVRSVWVNGCFPVGSDYAGSEHIFAPGNGKSIASLNITLPLRILVK